MSGKKVVVSIGGSILVPGNGDSDYIKRLADMLKGICDDMHIVIVCGGGKIARYYTETGKELGGNTYQLDMLGIGATRLNAGLLAIALGDISSTDIPLTVEETASRSKAGRITIMGGTVPGHTTDAVATMVAREMKADRVINATSVDAVYTDDPRKNPNAKRLSKITVKELEDLVYKEHGAGRSSVFDPLGVKIATEEKIDIVIVDGRDLGDLKNAILGNGVKGTVVKSR